MKLNNLNINRLFLFCGIAFTMIACSSDPLSPGIEYMPDMYRSPAIEEYVDYGEMKDRINDSVANLLSARQTVEGTIPFSEDRAKAQFNFPYAYANTAEDYELAGAILQNPIAFTEPVYLEGKEIYGTFCVHCHGEKGAGDGSITTKSGGAYPPPPVYSTIAGLTQGKMFHTLHYGKNNMGSHASQLTKEERWKVVHYVQTLVNEQYDNPFQTSEEKEEGEDNGTDD